MTNSLDLTQAVRRSVIDALWLQYRNLVPAAVKVEAALKAKSETWQEDHMAFRTLPGELTGSGVLRTIFEALGYEKQDDYIFEEKRLAAFWLKPIATEQAELREVEPKVFVSELQPEKFSSEFKSVLSKLQEQVSPDSVIKNLKHLAEGTRAGDKVAANRLQSSVIDYLTGLPPWGRVSKADYETLRKESEYAGWTGIFGNRVNHFTVSVHPMQSFDGLADLNKYLVEQVGVQLNDAGGSIIKGTPELRLEQSATLAAPVEVHLQDGPLEVPYAFIEFAYRHPRQGRQSDDRWDSYYQGFVAANADKIFESTDVR